MYGSQPVWSPGGYQITYPTYTPTGAALAITTETGNVDALPAPAAVTAFHGCVWSPNSEDVVCATRSGGRDRWLYALPADRRLIPGSSAGTPLAWITSGS